VFGTLEAGDPALVGMARYDSRSPYAAPDTLRDLPQLRRLFDNGTRFGLRIACRRIRARVGRSPASISTTTP